MIFPCSPIPSDNIPIEQRFCEELFVKQCDLPGSLNCYAVTTRVFISLYLSILGQNLGFQIKLQRIFSRQFFCLNFSIVLKQVFLLLLIGLCSKPCTLVPNSEFIYSLLHFRWKSATNSSNQRSTFVLSCTTELQSFFICSDK